jgi:hypothetical protein
MTLCGFENVRTKELIESLPSYMERATFCSCLVDFFVVVEVVAEAVEMPTRVVPKQKHFSFFQRGCKEYCEQRRIEVESRRNGETMVVMPPELVVREIRVSSMYGVSYFSSFCHYVHTMYTR